MATGRFTLHSKLPPAEAIAVLTDFGPDRPQKWPNVDSDHFTVHEVGSGWADITEGNDRTWERVRYEWDLDAATVSAATVDSNVWQAGPGWQYQFVPEGSGSTVSVALTRKGKTASGKVIAALLPLAAGSALKKAFRGPLQAS